jgi:4,5-DOPA dioxygenase extradiol
MSPLPSLFVSHGAPDLVVSGHQAAHFLTHLGRELPRPKAILIVSAHWERSELAVTTSPAPPTIHDFTGWPEELYRINYPAPGALWLAGQTADFLSGAGIKVAPDHRRGFDHGVWVPLHLAYPEADIPVVQLSLLRGGSARDHFDIGLALAPLRDQGVLIIGSGSAVHNLRMLAPEGTPPPPWALAFDQWLADAIERRDLADLSAFPDRPKDARVAHPTSEHLLPLFVALGAGWAANRSSRLHQSWSYGSLSMSAYAFGAKVSSIGPEPSREIKSADLVRYP